MGANTTHFNLPYPLPQDPVAVQLDIENLAQTIDETLNTTFATKTYADNSVSAHNSDSTNVHGIVDTSTLATQTYTDTAISTHESDTSTHGVTGNIVGTTDTQTLTNKTIEDGNFNNVSTFTGPESSSDYPVEIIIPSTNTSSRMVNFYTNTGSTAYIGNGGSMRTQSFVTSGTTSATAQLTVAGASSGVGTTYPIVKVTGTSSQTNDMLSINTSGGTKVMNVDKDGNVNIATGNVYKINSSEVLSSTKVLGKTPGGTTAGDIATINDTQTLTNKTISGSSNTLSNIANASLTNSSITINGTPVSLGGSTTVSGTISNALTIGTGLSGTSYNGSAAVTVAIDSTVATLTGSQTLTNKTITKPILLSPQERLNVSATAATGTINFNINTSAVWYYTTNATGNFVINARGDASTTLNSLLTTGDSITVAFLNTNGSTAYYNTSVQVDGTTSGVTTKWQGGTAPSSGNASSIDVYSYNIIKTGSATFTVLASITKFA